MEDTRNFLEAFATNEEVVIGSICSIESSIEDIFLAEVEGDELSDEEIAHYAKEITIVVANGVIDYLQKNYNLDAVHTKKALKDGTN